VDVVDVVLREIVPLPDDALTDVVVLRVDVVVVTEVPRPVVALWVQPAPSNAALRIAPSATGARPFLTVLS